MNAIVVTSAVNHRRIGRARAWLESRLVAEEVLIIGASLDAANELARKVAEEKGAAFGWHRVTKRPCSVEGRTELKKREHAD